MVRSAQLSILGSMPLVDWWAESLSILSLSPFRRCGPLVAYSFEAQFFLALDLDDAPIVHCYLHGSEPQLSYGIKEWLDPSRLIPIE